MSVAGVDTLTTLTATTAANILNSGYLFVGRYYSLAGNNKRMLPTEASIIGNAGLKRLVVYQNLHNAYSKFSSSIAAGDAADALQQAGNDGQPSGTCIYFAVDYNATLTEINSNIKSHFNVLKTMVTAAGYTLGVYGSSLVCQTLKNASIVSKTWLAAATSWGYGTTWNSWNVRQYQTTTVAGVSVDINVADSLTGFGGW